MDIKEEILKSDSKTEICVGYIIPENVKKNILIVHGFDDHLRRYKFLIVFALDLSGQGKSSGQRGHVNNYQEYFQDLETFFNFVKNKSPDFKNSIIGHSMGALILSKYFIDNQEYNFENLTLLSPFYGLNKGPSEFVKFFGKIIHRFYPSLSMKSTLELKDISRNNDVNEELKHDPLKHNVASLQWFVQTELAQEYVIDNSNKLNLPILLVISGEDTVVINDLAYEVFENIPGPKKLYILVNAFHETFNDPDRQKVFDEILNWIKPKEIEKV